MGSGRECQASITRENLTLEKIWRTAVSRGSKVPLNSSELVGESTNTDTDAQSITVHIHKHIESPRLAAE